MSTKELIDLAAHGSAMLPVGSHEWAVAVCNLAQHAMDEPAYVLENERNHYRESCRRLADHLRPITMQDVRLAVGEGHLNAQDVLSGCNAELRRRTGLTSELRP